MSTAAAETQAASQESPRASEGQALIASVQDLAGWAAVCGLAGERNLSRVIVEYGGGELRAVGTDAHILGLSRLYTAAGEGAGAEDGEASGKGPGKLKAVPDEDGPVPTAGKIGVTTFRPRLRYVIEATKLADTVKMLAKQHSKDAVVEVEFEKAGMTLSCGDTEVRLAAEGGQILQYQKLFQDVLSAERGKEKAPLIVNAEQLHQLVRSTGATTVARRRKLNLKVDGYRADDGKPRPLRIDLIREAEVLGDRRRWVGLVAPTIEA